MENHQSGEKKDFREWKITNPARKGIFVNGKSPIRREKGVFRRKIQPNRLQIRFLGAKICQSDPKHVFFERNFKI